MREAPEHAWTGSRSLTVALCLAAVLLGNSAQGTPVVRDITDEMNQAPSLSLDLESNRILGDPYNGVLPVMKTRREALDACLVSLTSIEGGVAPTFITVTITDAGRLEKVNIYGSGAEKAEQCLLSVLRGLDFGSGQERWGDVRIVSGAPQHATRDPAADELTWTTEAGGFAFLMAATRKPLEDGRWTLEIRATATALLEQRGVGHSLRTNTKLVNPDGSSENSFSMQDSTTVTRCLAPGESETFVGTPMGYDALSPGMRFEALAYMLGGDCDTGKGRWAVGTVHLDWTTGERPLLRATPP
jgi:hypothetical protein